MNSQEILETNKVIKLNKHLVNSQGILIDLFYIGPTVLYLQLLIIFHSTPLLITIFLLYILHLIKPVVYCDLSYNEVYLE